MSGITGQAARFGTVTVENGGPETKLALCGRQEPPPAALHGSLPGPDARLHSLSPTLLLCLLLLKAWHESALWNLVSPFTNLTLL